MKPINVLTIDDDVMVQKFIDLALADRGMTVWCAYDTADADAVLSRQAMDVIVCDVLMTPENGLDYCNRLQKRGVRTPVILASGQISTVAMKDGLAAGAAAYLIKPFEIEHIYQCILKVLADRSSPRIPPKTVRIPDPAPVPSLS